MKKSYNEQKFPCYPSCFLLGPTGPTGPTGPQGSPSTRIHVGTTTTSFPGSSAEVIEEGNEVDKVLNFVIPRGERGPVPNFIIGEVRTGDAGSQAQVIITPIIEER